MPLTKIIYECIDESNHELPDLSITAGEKEGFTRKLMSTIMVKREISVELLIGCFDAYDFPGLTGDNKKQYCNKLSSIFMGKIENDGNITKIVALLATNFDIELAQALLKRQEEYEFKLKESIENEGIRYISNTTDRLKKQSSRDWWLAVSCYIVSAICILACSILSLWRIYHVPSGSIPEISQIIAQSVLWLAFIGFSVAISKFMYTLGKSFMVESIKNTDRIHSIEFGKLYMNLFKSNFDWLELKDVLQSWNLDRTSVFASQDVKDIDPNILTILSDIAKNLTNTSK